MTPSEKERFDALYQQHLTQLTQLKLHDANQALNQLADRLHLDWELTV